MLKFLKPHLTAILFVVVLSIASNGLSLFFPKKIGQYIDAYQKGTFDVSLALWTLGGLALGVLFISFTQSAVSVYTANKIGFELRNKIIGSLKNRSFSYMRKITTGRLITTLTSDVDAIENLIASGIVSVMTAVVTLIGVIIFLLTIDIKLALITLSVLPVIMIVFVLVFKKLGPLFGKSQNNLDNINKIINESIVASSLVRVLNSVGFEMSKFDVVNKNGTAISQKIVTFFSTLIPVITLISNASVLIVLYFGGINVVNGSLTIGEMSAFFAYTSVFIWPFFILSFGSTFISRAQVSYKRIEEVLREEGNPVAPLSVKIDQQSSQNKFQGRISFKNVSLKYGEKEILKDISFEIKPGSKTAILGPTGAGKTELFYLIAGLAHPTSGEILIDDTPLDQWDQSELLSHIGMVFQDSIIFNTSFKENILFKEGADEVMLEKALEVAELNGLVKDLPQGLDTNVNERGTSLSGGQKQRLMLARALAIDPQILLLDDFTARVDAGTEERILSNMEKNFEGLTLISITQKIEPIKKYDHIIVLMEGELIGQGVHDKLIKSSLEYRQIYESQMSTENHD